jgi:hypothetical protein
MTFSDYVRRQRPSPRELPLVHTTECHHLDSIVKSQSLNPRHCGVFKEPLLYFFYGRPAYRDPSKNAPMKDISFCPICFVFRTGDRVPVKRVFPFDTGASQKPLALYEPQVPAADALLKFSVSAAIESARRIVRAFFVTDGNYFAGRARVGLGFTPGEVDAKAYYDLINGGGSSDCDDRRSAIEVQSSATIDLRGQLLAIVMPTSFLENRQLMKTLLQDWHGFPLTYGADVGMRPTEFHGVIREAVRGHYKVWGLL